jgi:chorismate mutase
MYLRMPEFKKTGLLSEKWFWGLHFEKSMLQYMGVRTNDVLLRTVPQFPPGGPNMSTKPKYYIVEASALPEVFLKVAEAKRLLSTGEASTVNEATRMTDISRSAFYKYRDSVLPFENMMSGRIVTFQFLIHDQPGLLANMLDIFPECNCNIQTINSIVPTNGTAVLTISAETMDLSVPLEELLRRLRSFPGVIKAEVLAG